MTVEHFDVIIVGAGLSGIGAARHLQDHCPGKTYVILEGRAVMGGTWDLFRYPGIRSDSDMYTLGYHFKPWIDEKAIVEGPAILSYIKETAKENNIVPHIRYQHLVRAAEWCSADSRWTLTVAERGTETGQRFSCNFLLMCSGYFSYRQGFCPLFPGRNRFKAKVLHPQEWPAELDYRGKKIVVIGSGATAVTLVPALAASAGHVTMLQRSPSYMFSMPRRDRIANLLRKLLPASWAYRITRWKNVQLQQSLYRRTRTDPEGIKKFLLDRVRKKMGPDYDVDRHLTPSYNPWDQRLCLVPENDFFIAVKEGRAELVTDHIDCFTETGILLRSGRELAADIIVTATGLNLVQMGEMDLRVDGHTVDFSKTWTYRGLMVSGVPNLVSTFGYINASWTLRADITAQWACRVINHLDTTGARQVMPVISEDEAAAMTQRPWIDEFSSGYMQRVMHALPRQGDREPWLNTQDYGRDKKMFRNATLEDGALQFTKPPAQPAASAAAPPLSTTRSAA